MRRNETRFPAMVINPSANGPPLQSCHSDQSEIHPRWMRHRARSLRIFHHTFYRIRIVFDRDLRRLFSTLCISGWKGKIINVHRGAREPLLANERRLRGLAGRIDIRPTEISNSLPWAPFPADNRSNWNRIGSKSDSSRPSFMEIRLEP